MPLQEYIECRRAEIGHPGQHLLVNREPNRRDPLLPRIEPLETAREEVWIPGDNVFLRRRLTDCGCDERYRRREILRDILHEGKTCEPHTQCEQGGSLNDWPGKSALQARVVVNGRQRTAELSGMISSDRAFACESR